MERSNPQQRKHAKLGAEIRREIDARGIIARQDMALGLASFIRPRIRGKRGWVEGIKQPWNGGVLTIYGPELDSGDLGVLLALLAAAVAQPAAQSRPCGQQNGLLPDATPRENAAAGAETILVQTTLADVSRKMGRDPCDGRAHASIRASLRRLGGFVIEAAAGDAWAQTHLIAGSADRGGAVSVALSYRLTRAILGDGSYSRIDMKAWAKLSPTAKILYHWLCAWRPGGGHCPPVHLDKLARHVWGQDAAQGATRRERRQQIRESLSQIADSAGWAWVPGDAPGVAMITAPSAPGGEATGA
ncbi:putative Replication protein C [Thiomonas sp. CB3]|nr:putative Replication protein C [Thiomonas sp. CB3]